MKRLRPAALASAACCFTDFIRESSPSPKGRGLIQFVNNRNGGQFTVTKFDIKMRELNKLASVRPIQSVSRDGAALFPPSTPYGHCDYHSLGCCVEFIPLDNANNFGNL